VRRTGLVIALGVLVLLPFCTYLIARAMLGSDLVRSSLEQQLSTRLGQPVRVGAATAAIFPRVALELHDVSIGEPPVVRVARARVITGLRGLWSRTVADAEVLVGNGRITMPLPFAPAGPAAPPAAPSSGAGGFTVTSIREITFRDIVLDAGEESLTIDLDASIDGDRLDIERLSARAPTTRLEASGALTSLARLEGALDARAERLDVDEMLAIGSAFTSTARTGGAARDAAPMHVVVKLTSPSGSFGTYTFTDLSTTIDLAPGRVALVPLAVRTFGGSFEGRLDADTTRSVSQLRLSGQLAGLDVPQLMKASGSPGGITGRLGGKVLLTASGDTTDALMRTARGSIGAAVVDGSIPGLDMVRTIVLAFGKPSGAPPAGSGSAFSRLGGHFDLAAGTLQTDSLSMTSRDFDMTGEGSLQILTGRLSARANVVLSQELTSQAGTDLRRYAQEDGRVVVPTTITGTLQNPSVSPDLAAATRRALENELKRRAKSFLEDLFRRKQ
jgi:uncharacterized protein involved in outer membrane biogenesis